MLQIQYVFHEDTVFVDVSLYSNKTREHVLLLSLHANHWETAYIEFVFFLKKIYSICSLSLSLSFHLALALKQAESERANVVSG